MNWLSHFQKKIQTPSGFSCVGCSKPHRCCDFTPFFPNFLVGAGLLQNKKLYSKIETKRFHPLGLLPPFEAKKDRICDFYSAESGSCLNWSFRPSECAGFYCESGLAEVNAVDEKWKRQSLSLFSLEMKVAQKALQHMGFSWRKISSWVDEWNDWVALRTPVQNSWSLSPEEKFEFYLEIWGWFKDSGDLVFDHLSEID